MKVVQLGSNRGYDDLSNHLLSNYDQIELGLFVEPHPIHIESLKECYKKFDNIIIEQKAIKSPFDKSDELEIFYYENDLNFEKASLKKEHLEKHRGCPGCDGDVQSFKVECVSLDNLLMCHRITSLDWLYIDVEGLDAEIMFTFDWKKYNIKKIEFEHLHLEYYADPIRNMLHGMRYVQVPSLHPYDWAFEKLSY
jgi:FkbM family methyltransferase